MGRRVLIVVTSCDQIGDTGPPTGWYLPEVAHPYHVFKEEGFACDFVSPKGGKAPMDPGSEQAFQSDPVCQEFLKDPAAMALLENTKTPDQISPGDYDVVFYAGGHGPMFDLPQNYAIAGVAAKVYESGGVLGAVCHGTVGLIPIKLSNGEHVIKDQTVTSFSNSEEDAVNLSSAMPFMLETRLKEVGAVYKAASNFNPNVCESKRIITGQNPASSTGTAEAIVKLLSGN